MSEVLDLIIFSIESATKIMWWQSGYWGDFWWKIKNLRTKFKPFFDESFRHWNLTGGGFTFASWILGKCEKLQSSRLARLRPGSIQLRMSSKARESSDRLESSNEFSNLQRARKMLLKMSLLWFVICCCLYKNSLALTLVKMCSNLSMRIPHLSKLSHMKSDLFCVVCFLLV